MCHFVLSPRKREKKDRIVERIKETDREERGTRIKVKKKNRRKKNIPTLPLPATRIAEKGKRKVQGVPQSQTAALPRPQEEEETDKSKQAQIEQTYEKH